MLFTRQPDYFDGVKVPATVEQMRDSVSGKMRLRAVFNTGTKAYDIDPHYIFRDVYQGKKVVAIYETGSPEKGAVYSVWGYWITWGELAMSVILCVVLFQVAVAVTNNPSAEAIAEQLDYKEEKKKKYLD